MRKIGESVKTKIINVSITSINYSVGRSLKKSMNKFFIDMVNDSLSKTTNISVGRLVYTLIWRTIINNKKMS